MHYVGMQLWVLGMDRCVGEGKRGPADCVFGYCFRAGITWLWPLLKEVWAVDKFCQWRILSDQERHSAFPCQVSSLDDLLLPSEDLLSFQTSLWNVLGRTGYLFFSLNSLIIYWTPNVDPTLTSKVLLCCWWKRGEYNHSYHPRYQALLYTVL